MQKRCPSKNNDDIPSQSQAASINPSGASNQRILPPPKKKKKKTKKKIKGGKSRVAKVPGEPYDQNDLSSEGSDSEVEPDNEKNYDGGDDNSDHEVEGNALNPIDLTDDKWQTTPLHPICEIGGPENIENVIPEFKGRHPGSQVNRTGTAKLVKSALQYFMLFFTSIILKTFIEATNAFGQYTTPGNRWKDLNEKEFKTFIGIILHMGVVKYPRRDLAWSKGKYGSPWVRSMMLQSRFEQILKCWHWVDTSKLSQKERAEKNKANS